MKIKGIGHIAYYITHLQQSLHFYTNILDFEKLFTIYDDTGNPAGVYLKIREGQFLELFLNYEDLIGLKKRFHLCFEVDDIKDIAAKIKEKGIPLYIEPKKGNDGNYQCWVKDPDGNPIEFMQMMPDCKQFNS